MRSFALTSLAIVCAAVLSACGGGGGTPTLPASRPFENAERALKSSASGTTITEFSLSATTSGFPNIYGQPSSGPNGDVWISDTWFLIHVMPTGSASKIEIPSPDCGVNCIFTGGAITREAGIVWFTNFTTAGTLSGSGISWLDASNTVHGPIFLDQLLGNLTIGNDGRAWFPQCSGGGILNNPPCTYSLGAATMVNGGTVDTYQLGSYIPIAIASGPDRNLYVVEESVLSYAPSVAQVTTAGKVLHRFPLPMGSFSPMYFTFSTVITTGCDHHLWIVENGSNKIARMSIDGALTQYKIPTSNADARSIVRGIDGNMWFTEFAGNRLARITPAGNIIEFPVTSANAGADGISGPFGNCASPANHGYVWFVEDNTDKLGRLNF